MASSPSSNLADCLGLVVFCVLFCAYELCLLPNSILNSIFIITLYTPVVILFLDMFLTKTMFLTIFFLQKYVLLGLFVFYIILIGLPPRVVALPLVGRNK